MSTMAIDNTAGPEAASEGAMQVRAGAGYVRVIIALAGFTPGPGEPTSRPGMFDERLPPDDARKWAFEIQDELGDPHGFAAALRAGANYAESVAAQQP